MELMYGVSVRMCPHSPGFYQDHFNGPLASTNGAHVITQNTIATWMASRKRKQSHAGKMQENNVDVCAPQRPKGSEKCVCGVN